ncbi:hypothetical protein GCM10022226_63860 [Sphaerisporangium flaviroseum]|uniref:DUF262 domain-containing protein n=1 Tax=Sphaerisporangium flaviroseum TaxID=509199 RepID=A0ABP7J391_9ACTN
MSNGLDTRPSATTYDVERLVSMAWQGKVRVPHFQRDFRWGREDVIRLSTVLSRDIRWEACCSGCGGHPDSGSPWERSKSTLPV